MSQLEKMLLRMRNNPHDWQIDELKDIAKRFAMEWRQPGGSHVTFRHPNGAKITVPAHRPIKPVYIKKFLRLLTEGEGE
jgi:hypothetical protein